MNRLKSIILSAAHAIFPNSQTSPDQPPRRVYIDCGSNAGHVLGARILQGSESEFYAFEPQPELKNSVDWLRTHPFPQVPLHFFNKAVWIKDGHIDFYLSEPSPNARAGSTALRGKNSNNIDYLHPITVESIDFSRWIRKTFRRTDYLVVKMDIEGAEYAVLERMVADGTIDYIDELMVEFHWERIATLTKERHDVLVASLKERVPTLKDWI
jgi:FkbM family methyltransferase